MTYKLLFIDEEKSAHGQFSRNFLARYRDIFVGESILPRATLPEMLDVILDLAPDAVLTDFSLNDYKKDIKETFDKSYEVEFNGGDLAKELHSIRENFPVFITTSLGDDAARDGADVKLIFEKYGSFRDKKNENGEEKSDAQHLTFADKLFHEITAYKKYVSQTSTEFDALFAKKNSDVSLTLKEEERLIELDGKLENLIDARSKVPSGLKDSTNAERLSKLISLTQQLLEKTNNG